MAELLGLQHHAEDACPSDPAAGREKVNHEPVVQQCLSLGRFAGGELQRARFAGSSKPLPKQGPALGVRRAGKGLCHPGGIPSPTGSANSFVGGRQGRDVTWTCAALPQAWVGLAEGGAGSWPRSSPRGMSSGSPLGQAPRPRSRLQLPMFRELLGREISARMGSLMGLVVRP